jgi:acid phosphatase type 7
MKALIALLLAVSSSAAPQAKRDVDTRYPYTGPDVPIGDWVDNTINGNGKGFPRLIEPPAVAPKSKNPTNSINVISLAYIPNGVNIHFQTPFGLTEAPAVAWGTNSKSLSCKTTGTSHT